ncbi:TPA: ATPase, partial [Candidatus Bathyarchaeota archaeon]|nr:ATPase [Candidatus Bathyarchaeota archaeon]
MSRAWHAMDIEEVLRALKANHEGLTDDEARRRLLEFGFNELVERRRVTGLQIFLRQFKDVFVIMLLIAIAISAAIAWYKANVALETPGLVEEYADAIAIGAIVVLNATVGFVQEYRSEKAMEAMKRLTAPKARLVRGGREVVVPAREVVPGDLVLLEAGDRVPADGRLIEAVSLKTDEAVLTGESTPVEKGTARIEAEAPVADRKNMVFMATYVIYGRGKALITSTGMGTEFGKIAEMVQTVEEKETPLKLKLERFARRLAAIIVVICALIFVLEQLRGGVDVVEIFMTAVALAVSAVPEGLPAIVTVTLALGARDLAKHNAIIRKLSSAETLGSTTVICSDKTGTLTKGEMTVRKIYVNGQVVEVTGTGYEPRGEFYRDGARIRPEGDAHLMLLLRIGALCNNARYDGRKIIGDPTEGALIVAAAKAGMRQEETERLYPRIDEIPFSSERKRMTTIHRTPEGETVGY